MVRYFLDRCISKQKTFWNGTFITLLNRQLKTYSKKQEDVRVTGTDNNEGKKIAKALGLLTTKISNWSEVSVLIVQKTKVRRSPHPCQHQLSNHPNHNISQAYLKKMKFEEGEGHWRRKWIPSHNKIEVEKSCDHHRILSCFYPPAKSETWLIFQKWASMFIEG